ncbi:MAG: hypothetical protein M1505_01060 [Patescibacteria group bacterium]|nr:hypothetical protein [Patescibacteria group bacterium]MCL5257807.1 hypothetical protein [Patescibacteria group bacterium]
MKRFHLSKIQILFLIAFVFGWSFASYGIFQNGGLVGYDGSAISAFNPIYRWSVPWVFMTEQK